MSYMPNSVARVGLRKIQNAKVQSFKVFGILLLAVLAASGLRGAAQLPGLTMTNSGPLTLASGAYGSVTVTLTPVAGYSATVVVTCTNLPVNSQCIYPNLNQQINVPGAAATMNITVNTSLVYKYETKSVPQHRGIGSIAAAALLAPAGLLLFAFRRKSLKGLGAMRSVLGLVVLASIAGLSGCGSTKPATTPAGTYPIVITAGYNSIPIASTTLTLVVQ